MPSPFRPLASFALALAFAASAEGCTGLTEAATANFHQQFPANQCPPAIVQRSDLGEPLDGTTLLEASACGDDVILSCYQATASEDGSTSPAACRSTDMCTAAGCDQYVSTTRHIFSRGNACPLDRVQGKQVDKRAPSPPADIAGDPERLVMWTAKQQADRQGSYFYAVEGCDLRAVYSCLAGYPPRCYQEGKIEPIGKAR